MTSPSSVCVYCGSSPGREPHYVEHGRVLGGLIAQAGLRLVYGGGTRGIMGAVSSGAIEAGGKVTGIIPRFLLSKEAADGQHPGLDELLVVDTMHTRKHMMFERSEAFIAMPGGIGTVEEIIEIMTWAQLGHHSKPMIFANLDGFWNPMRDLLDHMAAEGFVHTAHKVRPLFIEAVDEIVPVLLASSGGRKVEKSGDDAVIERM